MNELVQMDEKLQTLYRAPNAHEAMRLVLCLVSSSTSEQQQKLLGTLDFTNLILNILISFDECASVHKQELVQSFLPELQEEATEIIL